MKSDRVVPALLLATAFLLAVTAVVAGFSLYLLWSVVEELADLVRDLNGATP